MPTRNRLLTGKNQLLLSSRNSYDGKIIKKNLTKARISRDEIEETAIEHSVKSIEEINLAILEIDGNISILSNDYKTKPRRKKKHYIDIV